MPGRSAPPLADSATKRVFSLRVALEGYTGTFSFANGEDIRGSPLASGPLVIPSLKALLQSGPPSGRLASDWDCDWMVLAVNRGPSRPVQTCGVRSPR